MLKDRFLSHNGLHNCIFEMKSIISISVEIQMSFCCSYSILLCEGY